MKLKIAIALSLLISTIFILCVNVNYFIDPKNSIKDNEETQTLKENLSQNFESPKSSAPLNPKDAYAIVVGISDYPGTSSDLSYCDDDSQDVYSMLINDFNFKSENVYYLQDSSASKGAISDAFDQIASQISDDDIFFFYYSGHGGAGTSSTGIQSYSIDSPHPYPNNYDHMWNIYRSGAIYMRVHFDHFDVEYDYDYVLLGDSDLASGWYYEGYTGYSTGFWSGWIPLLSDNRLYIRMITDYSITEWGFSIDSYEAEMYDGTHFLCSYDSIPSTPSNYYMDYLLDSKLDQLNCAEKYVVLDSCHSGGMIPEVQEIGRYIMTACRDDEFSLEDPSLQHGVFTNYFLNSFEFATDSNVDGVISMQESYTYTSANTISYSSGLGYTHHPQQYDGISGESVLITTFGALNLIPTGNSLSYSFYMYGTGLLEDLRIAVCNISETITSVVEDLTENPASNTGFGYYSGTLQMSSVTGITDYGIFARISGNDVIFLNQTVSNDSDSDSIDDIIEIMFGMNISDTDSDSDGLDDIVEFYGTTDPSSNDTDNDGLLDGEEVLIYFTDPTNSDTDNDGLLDGEELLIYFTDPFNSDTDGDGMDDYFEVLYGLDPLINDANLDPDFDNIPNIYEYGNNTNPQNADTDGDNIDDGDEIFIYLTDPTTNDTDGDFLTDDFEIFIYLTNATNIDTEGDGMDDFYEYTYNLDPFIDDSGSDLDGDGLINILEYQCGANPNLSDSDGDYMNDFYEYNCHLNPLANDADMDYDNDGLSNLEEYILNSLADDTDSDDDLMPDGWEYNFGLDLTFNDADLDHDNDGLINILEYQCGTCPHLPDSDGDFMTDFYEYNCHLNPLADDADLDNDSDGLSNILEFLLNSLADDTDSDNDLMPDGWEYNNGLDLTTNDGHLDNDEDGLNNWNEYLVGTDPNLQDTDNDGLSDGSEVHDYLTNPLNADTDGDGYMDGIEVAWGADPLNPNISLNTVFLNFLGIALIISSVYFTTRTSIASKKQSKKSIQGKKAFKFDKEAEPYNAVKIEKKFKPKPTPTYPTYTQRPTYYEQKGTFDMDKIREIILYRLPPAKSPYSVEGKRALNVANNALQQINRGDVLTGTQNIIEALMLGVPEPLNSRFKATILESMNRMKPQVKHDIPASMVPREQPINKPESQVPADIKYCTSCGQQNNSSNKFCKNCGGHFD